MNCKTLIEFLADYLSGELPADQRAVFEEHLAECEWCVDYLRTYEEAVQMGRAVLTTPDAPAAGCAPEELIQAILAARGASTGPR
jgi:anti-sigma factor RsiW